MKRNSDRLDFAKSLATKSGELLLSYFGGRQNARMKSIREAVTDADIRSEELILDAVDREFGEPVLSEEFRPDTPIAGPLWVVDPLDGTNNFAAGIPFFAVIIAFVEDGETRFGVIHEPIRGETFWTDGESSYLGDERISVSSTKRLADSMAATGFPYLRGAGHESNLENFVRVAMSVRGIRRSGSAGLDLAYTAAGRFDFYWELNLKPWDIAAGELLVRCAGGKTGLFDGSPWSIGHDRVLAANPTLFGKASSLLSYEGA